MNFIVMKTAIGAPLAMLLLSTPVAPQRDCIFTMHPQIPAAILHGREAQVIFPDRPVEYRCSYASSAKQTLIQFENQIGWKFVVRIGARGDGTWSASRDAEAISGDAFAPFND